ncbi:MAG: polyprenyl synthetase family protein [Puniceicoccaceae bacterium]|nr:MAG: polyprenyl synthetase family protein [Puniceicoccaceae bacterium]
MDFKEKLAHWQQEVDAALPEFLPGSETRPARLHQAMLYSLEAGGKRLRPVLVLAAAETFSATRSALPAALAVECLHTYSLIHDDLPCMDDGELRRGRPTCHRQFDEATAVLAGDALLTHAFALLATHYADTPELAATCVAELAAAAGSTGLIGGQMEDIEMEERAADAAALDYIHRHKTGALITAALLIGARHGNPRPGELAALREFGDHLGLAFQIVDDLLDVTSTTEALGKTTGADQALKKNTYVSIHGLARTRAAARHHTAEAIRACRRLQDRPTDFFQALAARLETRVQ